MSRPSSEEYFLTMAELVSTRATCVRRKVGCILVNVKNHVLATGYNGVARGLPHCIDVPCDGAHYPSGEGLDQCEAIHAEQNALLQCKDVDLIHKAYVTTAPCITCTKLLMNTECKEIIFLRDYPNSERSKRLWESVGRKWTNYGATTVI